MRATSLIKSVIDNSTQLITHYYQSPCGVLEIIHNNTSVSVIRWCDHDNLAVTENNAFFAQVRRWLDCYFSGQEPQGGIELTLAGTDFQRRVAANDLGGYSGKTQGVMLDRKHSLLTCDKELSR